MIARKTLIRWATALALAGGATLASAGDASVSLSNLEYSVDGGAWWAWVVTEQTWVPETSGANAQMGSQVADGSSGWLGAPLSAQSAAGTSLAEANVTAGGFGGGGAAEASVHANDPGQSGWAAADFFNGLVLLGSGTTFTVRATVDGIHASGADAQAFAFIELCGTDFTTDTCQDSGTAEAFATGTTGDYSGPTTLTATWTNPDIINSGWAKLQIGVSAVASADVLAIPEPASGSLMLAGMTLLLGVAARRSRRR